VSLAGEPALACLSRPDPRGEETRPVAAVEGADLGPGLPEAGVVGCDREVADHVQDVPAADRVSGHHRDDGFRQPPDLDLEIQDVEATDTLVVDVAVVAPDALVATGAEGLRALPRENDHADGRGPPGPLPCRPERPEGTAPER